MTSCACTRGESDPGRESEFGTTPVLSQLLGIMCDTDTLAPVSSILPVFTGMTFPETK